MYTTSDPTAGMMGNPSLLGTPVGYATPEQVKSMYEYSKYLGQGEAQFPVITKPIQGVSNIVNALMGGWLSNRANAAAKGTAQYDASRAQQSPVYSPYQVVTNQDPNADGSMGRLLGLR